MQAGQHLGFFAELGFTFSLSTFDSCMVNEGCVTALFLRMPSGMSVRAGAAIWCLHLVTRARVETCIVYAQAKDTAISWVIDF